MRRAAAATATAATLSILAQTPATAHEVDGCPPGTSGVVIHYEDPRGWITIHIPLCFTPR